MGVFRGLVPRGRSVVLAIPAIMLLALWLVFLSIETGHPVSPKRLRARPRGAALARKPVVRPAGRTTGGGSLFTQKRRSKNRPKAAQPRAASVTLGGGSARDIEASFHFVFVTECSRAHHQHFAVSGPNEPIQHSFFATKRHKKNKKKTRKEPYCLCVVNTHECLHVERDRYQQFSANATPKLPYH